MNEGTSNTSAVLLALLGGAVIGAGIALLYAPQSGRRTRQKLKDLGEDAEEYARELLGDAEKGVEKAKRKGEEWLHKGQDFVESKIRQVSGSQDGSKDQG